MRFRHYIVQTNSKANLALLEDRLHNHVHSENILRRDSDMNGQVVKADRPKLLDTPEKAETLYGVLGLNEFNIEDKQVKRLRLFTHPFIITGESLPKYEASLLISGEAHPLIAIHDYLVTDPHYLVQSAKDVKNANWATETASYNEEFIDGYLKRVEELVNLDFLDLSLVSTKKVVSKLEGTRYSSKLSVRGSIENVFTLRKILKLRFNGVDIISESLDYS